MRPEAVPVSGSRISLRGVSKGRRNRRPGGHQRGWQRGVYEAQSQAVMDAGVPKSEASLIFGENLRRLLSGS